MNRSEHEIKGLELLYLRGWILKNCGLKMLNDANRVVNERLAKTVPDVLFIDEQDGAGREGYVVTNDDANNK